jgi:hypothetical protein
MKLVTLHDRHPIWAIIRMGVLGSVAIGVLQVTASSFDSGELKAAGAVTLASAIFDVLKRQFAGNLSASSDD